MLLLNRSPASNTIELVYLGLAPAARGRGLGRQLLRHGLHLLGRREERAITLAVDEQNDPALALYRGEGFRRVLRRIALIRPLGAAASPT
jgi:ribosomal-protein-alanine N-acetyltransferase